jgi:hypothetical protein
MRTILRVEETRESTWTIAPAAASMNALARIRCLRVRAEGADTEKRNFRKM